MAECVEHEGELRARRGGRLGLADTPVHHPGQIPGYSPLAYPCQICGAKPGFECDKAEHDRYFEVKPAAVSEQVNASAAVGLKDSGARQEFDTGAVRDAQEGKGRYDLLPFHALERLAKIYEAGAKKYDDENWRKGMPCRRFLESALRHLCQYGQGQRAEDHLAQALFNIAGLMETEWMCKRGILPIELADMPDWYSQREAGDE